MLDGALGDSDGCWIAPRNLYWWRSWFFCEECMLTSIRLQKRLVVLQRFHSFFLLDFMHNGGIFSIWVKSSEGSSCCINSLRVVMSHLRNIHGYLFPCGLPLSSRPGNLIGLRSLLLRWDLFRQHFSDLGVSWSWHSDISKFANISCGNSELEKKILVYGVVPRTVPQRLNFTKRMLSFWASWPRQI